MTAFLWIPVSLFAGLTQIWRNGLQSDLTERIGAVGATQVRFLYGLPFALLFLALACLFLAERPALAGMQQLVWTAAGALAQITGTAMMLIAMKLRSFAIGYVYIKTEPILIAVAGSLLLGDYLSGMSWLGIVLATFGVVLAAASAPASAASVKDWQPVAAGLAAAALFGVSAVLFRGAILEAETGSFIVNALTVLCLTLTLQSSLLALYMAVFDRRAMTESLRLWRISMGAGLLGALSSAAWFIAFALTAAVNVRTVGLIEMPAAALFNRRLSGRHLNRSEWASLALVVVGVGIVLQQALVPNPSQ